MDKQQALKELKKLYGAKAGYRRNEAALTYDERERVRLEVMPGLNVAEKEALAAMEARRAELLKDPEYIRLKQVALDAQKARQEMAGRIYTRRVTVGKFEGDFFVVTGDGDNWAQAIKNAKKE